MRKTRFFPNRLSPFNYFYKKYRPIRQMKVITHTPSKLLKQFVKQIWIVEENGALNIDLKSFPVGYSFINVIDGNPFSIINKGNKYQTKSYLAGPKTTFFRLQMSYIRRAITIQLKPYSLPYLFNIPASEFYDEIVSLDDFAPKLASAIEELIASDLTSIDVCKRIEDVLLLNLNQEKEDNRVSNALGLIVQSGGNINISDLSDKVNISQRRLQQLFQYNFGLSAKSYSRIVKMQYHTFQILKGKDLDEIIPDGYYDQSHYIHELKKQTGLLPNDFHDYINHETNKMAYLTSNLYFKND